MKTINTNNKCIDCVKGLPHKFCPQLLYDKKLYKKKYIKPLQKKFNQILNDDISNPYLLFNLLDNMFDKFLNNYNILNIDDLEKYNDI